MKGTVHSRLEVDLNVLLSLVEILCSAESRRRDVDIAMESASLVRLQQSGISVLARSNVEPRLVLSMLQSQFLNYEDMHTYKR